MAEASGSGLGSSSPGKTATQPKQIVKLDTWMNEMHVDEAFHIEYVNETDKLLYPGLLSSLPLGSDMFQAESKNRIQQSSHDQ